MSIRIIRLSKVILRALALAFSIAGVCAAQTTPPNLTQPGVIAGIDRSDTFNLGPTGLRGWIHVNTDGFDYAASGRITDASRQILVTIASAPGNAVLAVDDVILGAIAASSGTVPAFTSDARKAFGASITEAEKTGAGTLRVKRWRAGTTTDVNITIPTLGEYSATAPYHCPKSAQILANTRDQMVGELLANSNYLNSGNSHANAIQALALLASVQPGDPNYSAVQSRLQTYARSLANRIPSGGDWNWDPAYQLVFLAEYYLFTSDSQVVPTINAFTLWLVETQSMWGTYGHAPSILYQDGSGRRISNGYGPVNSVGNIANLAIVLGKKALQAAGQSIDPEIDAAIQRASDFLGSYVNRGGIPYGEHMPTLWHASNGKDASAAVFFGLQAAYAVQAEYYSRMAIAGWAGVDVGHAGQELGLLWAALGAGMGGESAASGHFKQLLWRFDVSRRTNGSFTYDSRDGDYYSGGSTSDGTYLGNSAQYGVKGTAINLLTYSLPLKRLHITGKQANPAYTLDPAKVANAVSAGSFRIDRSGLSISELFTALGEYDPVVRYYASVELAARSLTSTDLTNLHGLLASPDPNLRQSAAEVLGIRKDATALPTLVGMLNDPDHWVRHKAAAAINNYNTSTISTHRDALINAFIANAPADPDVINWADPLQFSQSTLSDVLFRKLATHTINAPKTTHLYPALRAGLSLPTGAYRSPVAAFARDRLNLTDLQSLFPELVQVASYDTPADRMFSAGSRANAIDFMAENEITEGIPIALFSLETVGEFGGEYTIAALRALASYGDAARYTLPTLRGYRDTWPRWDNQYPFDILDQTILTIEDAIAAPTTHPGLCVANSQIVATTGAKAITLTGASPRGAFSFLNVTQPAHGTLTGTAPNLNYTPNAGYSGTDKFTFQTADSLTTSDPATVSIIVGSSGNGIVGEYFNNADFTSPVLTRTDPQINFDWGTGSPDPSIGADTFSTRWSGFLLAPETGTYTLSGLTSDGIRAYLNGVSVINHLHDQSTRWTDGQPISLTAGQKVPLLVEYYENTGSAVAKLKWTGPSFAGLNGEIIPQPYFFDSNSTGGPDTTPPVITAYYPADNATGVAHATDLVATFSENIVRGTGNITLKNLSDGTQTAIAVTDTTQVTISGATLIINPTALLVGGKNHAVRIDATAIDDTAGNSFAGINNDTTWNFTTTAPDTTKPTPNPMSFAVPPQTAGSTSITMTATTASDPSGVEYRFNNVTLGTSSPWQNSPVYTATGLAPSTSYTFTVQARDKSAAGNTTSASAPANGRTLGDGPLDLMSLNFYAYGPLAVDDRHTVTLEAGESAGLGTFHVSGWQNYSVPWGLSSPAAPFTLTSSVGSTATMRLNDVRNGWTFSDVPHTFFVGGDGDLMNGHANGTEDPYDQSALFNMDISNIHYPSYELIVYLGSNEAQSGDGTGEVVFNGGAEQGFTLPSGQFAGFVEITNATTPGNYIVFRGLTNPSLNLKVWGNGFNHIGPAGFQIVNYGAITGATPPTITTLKPADNATGVAVGANLVATFSKNIARGTGNITVKNLSDGTQTTIAVTDTAQVSISEAVLTINPTASLLGGKNYAVQIAATAIDDTAGNSFAGITNDTTWNFATEHVGGPLDVMSVNFYAYGGLSSANHNTVTLEAGETAGLGTSNVSGWQNYEVPWGLDSPAAPFTLTSNLGATATLTLNDVRNGWTDDDQPNPNFGGSGDLMDSQAQGTEDPYDESAQFDMTVSNIPYQVYDLIVYLGANASHVGDGTGKLILNGGAVQNFKVSSGPFAGFVEITNATTPGNYIVFRKLRTSSFTLKVWGNGFNHIGPAGFQIVKDTSGVLPPGPASNPNPQDATVGHASGTDLSWTEGVDALSRNVYFGTNPSPGAGELRGNQTATTFDPGNLANGTYYWRIDEINADGTTTGPVWSFSVGPPAKALRPMPWNGMKAVATNVGTLKWVAGKSAIASSHDVYFGTNPTPGAAEFKGNQSGTTFNPGPLTPGTTYYWRVDQVNAQGTGTGDVWSFTTPRNSANKVKVFILAGQSNMVGHGEMEPIGTQGTLQFTYNNDPVTYAHLKNGSLWAVRDDAWIWYRRDGTLVKGGLTTGYGAGSTTIGPELQFGHAMGEHYGQKVLLIKIAWGGKSLQTDFRPPSAGWNFDVPGKEGDQGYNFTEMLEDVIDATANLQTHFPAYNPADGFEFAGFAWHQGWNDLVSTSASAEYEANMEKFIKDVRFAVGVPNLPFVIATTGQSNPTTYSTVELAQLKMEDFTKYPAFNGNVSVVDTKSFWIPASSSPADEGYHWNRNAKSYYLIGDALASEMIGLQADTTPPTISTYSPANNATGVAVGANLVATFSDNIVRGTGNLTLRNLTDGTQTNIPVTDTAQVSISGAVLTINPTANLTSGKNYAVQIAATAIKDPANNAFAGITNDTVWNFTTLTDYDVWGAKCSGANLTDPNADFDGDGLNNNYERIWGLDPTHAAARNPFSSLPGPTNGTFSYTRRVSSLTGLSYTVWTSTNLTTWAQDTGAIQTPGAAVAEVETVSVTVSPALVTGPQLFIRMRAAQS
ncbi:MAG: Ig-like domain-containing protein [Verrucomicrobia bacterium]|nr:Ig-like domain-containing protein [Verrucomicrobiota bacterium]